VKFRGAFAYLCESFLLFKRKNAARINVPAAPLPRLNWFHDTQFTFSCQQHFLNFFKVEQN